MIANISSSVTTTSMQNPNHSRCYGNRLSTTSWSQSSRPHQWCRSKCSNPVVTCIVATVLPITITSLLICGFMVQKNNLHEYAIYTFVIFCLAFIFPFALFFFTVIIHKILRFFKILTPDSHQSYTVNHTVGHNHSDGGGGDGGGGSPSMLRHSRVREYDCEYHSEAPYRLPLDYNRVFVNLSSDQYIVIEDSPPSYEMALLCPTVQLFPVDSTKPTDKPLDDKHIESMDLKSSEKQ